MKKLFTGTVTSTKMDKTVVVRVEKKFRHPMYHKVIKQYKNFKAHCEDENIKEGDIVSIRETSPRSKTKFFQVVELQK
jgi:small subunit ribosomal protein S17